MKYMYLVRLSDSNEEKEEVFKEIELCELNLKEAALSLSRLYDLDTVEFACKENRSKFKVMGGKIEKLDVQPKFLVYNEKDFGKRYSQYIRRLEEELYNISRIPKELLGNE